MRRSGLKWGLFAAIVVLAAALRFPGLDLRPMHADESVHAAKMGRLLEQGRYEYDPVEFHGPTLNYLTLLPARLKGAVRYADLDEVTLRIVPATMGVLLVAATALLVPLIGFRAAALAALLCAVSPAMVYYSRYYIQETLLLAFSFGALISIGRYLRSPRLAWAISAGASVGLMQATKETWVIAVVSMAGGLGLTAVLERWRGAPRIFPDKTRYGWHLLAAVLVAAAVSALLFSSFLRNPRGIVDSVLAYRTYVGRAAGLSTWHLHPWHYYFDLLLFFRAYGGPAFSEVLIVGLGLAGLVGTLARAATPGVNRKVIGFLAFYTVLMATVYSAIPYKTPWCLLGFLHGLVLLAGVGAAHLIGSARSAQARVALVALFVAGTAHLGWQAWAASFRYAADPRNPWVYAHTSTDVFEIARRVEALALAHPQGLGMPVEVISDENLWPLPWYLRRLTAVRWERAVPQTGAPAPLILTTPDMEEAVARRLYESRPPGERDLYMNVFNPPLELRPQVEVRGYAVKWLWDRYRATGR
jgi:uncharacterized protein (TIGR03663 family)